MNVKAADPESKAPCRWCRVKLHHLECCPHDSTLAQQIWESGRVAALNGRKNPHANDPTYSLGFNIGEIQLVEELVREKRSERISESRRPSHPPPSVTELVLALNERNDPPDVPYDSAGALAFGAGVRELLERDADLF